MAADVELRVAVTEVQQAVRQLGTVGSAMQQLGTDAAGASREARDAFQQLDRTVVDVGDQIEKAIEQAMRSVEIEVNNGMFDVVHAMDRNADRIVEALQRAGQRGGAALAEGVARQPIPTPSSEQERGAEGFGSGLAKKAVAAFTALFALDQIKDLFAQALGQEQTTATLGASLNLNPDQTAAAGKAAGELYAQNYAASVDDGADLIKSVLVNRLADPNDSAMQQALAGRIASIAAISGEDANSIANAASQAVTTGLATDSSNALDLITRGFQSGANVQDDFLDTLNEYGTQFRKLGLDGPSAVGLISQAMQGGARNSDLAADALKEFSIRAVDGSKLTAQGFTAVGLDANTMAQRIAAGGDSAAGALGDTLTALKGMHDPVAQSQAAVALFGTQAEDLGAALYSMDIPSATGQLGDLNGAAQDVGDRMSDTAQNKITVFWRELQQHVVQFIADEVIPRLTDLWTWLVTNLGPAFEKVGAWIRDDLVPWLKDAADWYQRNKEWIDPLVVALGAFVAVMVTMSIIKDVTLAVIAFNAALMANPVLLVIGLIAALVAGLIYAWNTSDTFRAVVTTAWEMIKGAAQAAWDTVIWPVLQALWGALQWVGEKATWLWQNAIQPAWDGISSAATWLWDNILHPYFDLWWGIVSSVGDVYLWLWNEVVLPVAGWIGDKVTWLWNEVIQPIWTNVQTFISGIGSFFTGIWQGVSDALNWTKQTIQDIKDAISGFFDEIDKKSQDAAANAAQQGVGGIGTVTGTDQTNILGSGVAGGSVFGGTAAGGLISGAGGPRADKVGRFLSPGEFVVNATSTSRHLPLIRAINEDTGMADGGLVMGQAGVDLMFRAITGYGGPLLKQGEDEARAAAQARAAGMGGGIYTGPLPAGDAVERWRPMALQALAAVGAFVGQNLLPFIGNMLLQITTESSGNPAAINDWDVNAQRGTPSMGLLQVIYPTFVSALTGTPFANLIGRGLTDPWANMISSILYGLNTYHSLDRAYRGVAYDMGGALYQGFTPVVNHSGGTEEVLNPEERATWVRQVRSTNAGRGGTVVQAGAVQIVVQGNLSNAGQVRAELEAALREILAEQEARAY